MAVDLAFTAKVMFFRIDKNRKIQGEARRLVWLIRAHVAH